MSCKTTKRSEIIHQWCCEIDFQCFYFQLKLSSGSPYLFQACQEWSPMGTLGVAAAQDVAETFKKKGNGYGADRAKKRTP